MTASFSSASGGAAVGPVLVSAKAAPFSAKGDGRQVYDAAMTSGSAALSSAAAAFTAADVGKVVVVNGAGASGASLNSSILSVAGGVATLANTAGTTVSAKGAVFGTDDTAAIQAAIDSLVPQGGGTVFLPAGIYVIDGPYRSAQTASFGTPDPLLIYRAQITIPAVDTTASDAMPITLLGEEPAYRPVMTTITDAGLSTVNIVQRGRASQLVSTRTDGSHTTLAGWACMIGGPDLFKSQRETPRNPTAGWTNVDFRLKNLVLKAPNNPTLLLVGLELVVTAKVDECHFATTAQHDVTYPTNPSGQALAMPTVNNYSHIEVRRCVVEGFYGGITLGEHTTLADVDLFLNRVALCAPRVTQIYPVMGYHVRCEANTYLMARCDPVSGVGSWGSNGCFIDIDMLQIEDGSAPWATTAHVWASNSLIGRIRYFRKLGTWTVTGSSRLQYENLQFDPSGSVNQPAGHLYPNMAPGGYIRKAVADTAYTVGLYETLVAYTTLTAPRTATLPNATFVPVGWVYTVKDEAGTAGTSNITVATTSAQTIDGAATKVVNTNFGSLRVYSNGANWLVV